MVQQPTCHVVTFVGEGEMQRAAIPGAEDVWIGSGFQQLSPDQRIGAVGYALVAATVPGSGITGTIPDPRLTGNVGIGTMTPAYPLVVQKRVLPVGNDQPFVPRVMPDVRKLFYGFHSDPE